MTLVAIKRSLIERFDALPNLPDNPADLIDHEVRCDGLVWLIGWIEDHPHATREEYREEVRRTQEDGPAWK